MLSSTDPLNYTTDYTRILRGNYMVVFRLTYPYDLTGFCHSDGRSILLAKCYYMIDELTYVYPEYIYTGRFSWPLGDHCAFVISIIIYHYRVERDETLT